jgi:Protein of unknown function (DUF2442)
MNTLIDTPKTARYEGEKIVIEMSNGEVVSFSTDASSRLKNATSQQLSNIELSPFGLHWPLLDEDLSLRGILAAQTNQTQ